MSKKNTKDCIIFLQDVGRNMSQPDVNGEQPLVMCKDCISQILLRKLFSQSKDVFTIITFGDKETKNSLATGTQYKNINEYTGNFLVVDRDFLRLLEKLEVNNDNVGDWLDAIVVAMQYYEKENRNESYDQCHLVMFSNFNSPLSVDGIDAVIEKFNDMPIHLTVIGPKDIETDKQNSGKQYLLKMIQEVKGTLCSFDTARLELMHLTRKPVRPTPWNALLTISSKIKIPIRAFKRVAEIKPYKWMFGSVDDENTSVQKETAHVRYDEEKEVEVQVERDDLINAYLFGSTIVPVSDADQEIMSFKSGPKGLYFIGCTPKINIPQYILAGDGSYIVLSRQGDSVGKTMLESFIQAMFNENLVGIVRKVYNENNAPRIGILHPQVNDDERYLIYVDLPFAEDEHIFKFPSLTNDITLEQMESVDNLVDSMDLDVIDKDGDMYDYTKVYDPHEQYVLRSLGYRYMYPKEPLPMAILEELSKLMEPSSIVTEKSKQYLTHVKEKLPLKKIIKKSKNPSTRVINDDTVDENKTSTLFKKPVENSESSTMHIKNSDLSEEILNYCEKRLDKCNDSDELDNLLLTLRKNCIENDFKMYNDVLMKVKEHILKKEHHSIWKKIFDDNLGPITKNECSISDVDDDFAIKFFSLKEDYVDNILAATKNEDNISDSWLDDL